MVTRSMIRGEHDENPHTSMIARSRKRSRYSHTVGRRGSRAALLPIVVPDNALSEALVHVQVYVRLADADTLEPADKGPGHEAVTGCGGVAADIHGNAAGVGGVARPPVGLLVGLAAVGGIEDQRNTDELPEGVKPLQERRVHLADIAGRGAVLELRGGEILTHWGFLFPFPPGESGRIHIPSLPVLWRTG